MKRKPCTSSTSFKPSPFVVAIEWPVVSVLVGITLYIAVLFQQLLIVDMDLVTTNFLAQMPQILFSTCRVLRLGLYLLTF
jgi:hypothetical protein